MSRLEAWINELSMTYGGNWWPLGILSIGIIVGLVFLRGWRKALIIPGILITVAVMNPWFYNLWNKMVGRSYWRCLWMLPIIPMAAMIPALVVEKNRNKLARMVSVIAYVVILILTGSFIYNNPLTTFAKAKNADKLPDDVVAVGDFLLGIDEEPYVITDATLSPYLRQYSGKIKSLYGRDIVYNGGFSMFALGVYRNLTGEDGDYYQLAEKMRNNDYEYLVTDCTDKNKKQALENSGFSLIKHINNYGLFQATGKRTIKHGYDGLHRVISVTTLDENENPVNNEKGYATLQWEYDENNRVSYTACLDMNGDMVSRGGKYLRDYLYYLNDILQKENVTIVISARDEATKGLTHAIALDIQGLGLKTNLFGKEWKSYYAIISSNGVIEEMGDKEICYDGDIKGAKIHVSSDVGPASVSSISFNGEEYSTNRRGLNIVVYNNQLNRVIQIVSVDTHETDMEFMQTDLLKKIGLH